MSVATDKNTAPMNSSHNHFQQQKRSLPLHLSSLSQVCLPPSSYIEKKGEERERNGEKGEDNKLKVEKTSLPSPSPPNACRTLTDYREYVDDSDSDDEIYDDPSGYYTFHEGDLLAGRYSLTSLLGCGVFSSVFKAKDNKTDQFVAVKVVRKLPGVEKLAEKELDLLQAVSDEISPGKENIISLLDRFRHRKHECFVFPAMETDLKAKLKRDREMNINDVQKIGRSLLAALIQMKACGVLHGDLKPANVLIKTDLSELKVCDFGCGCRLTKNPHKTLIQSLWYRAPEVILGLPYNESIDLWSVGCILFELYMGRVAFPGDTTNKMLDLVMRAKGQMPEYMKREGKESRNFFKKDGTFLYAPFAPTKNNPNKKLPYEPRVYIKPVRTVSERMNEAVLSEESEREREKAVNLCSLLENIFTLDPMRRITLEECRKHPFFM